MDVNLVLEGLKSELIQVGEWVNVIGYVTETLTARRGRFSEPSEQTVRVQALLLWKSGPLDIQQYESCFVGSDDQVKAESATK